MRILANENFPGTAVRALQGRGHDVAWVRFDAAGSSDIEVLARAQAEGRILVTFDKDFGELATGVAPKEQKISSLPSLYELQQNYPNPFYVGTKHVHAVQYTTIPFTIPENNLDRNPVTIKIFDILGREVKSYRVDSGVSGRNQIRWDGKDLNGQIVGNGIYFYKFTAGNFSDVKKLVVVR